MRVHATSIDWAGLGVLILGGSGQGKSDFALRLMAQGAVLVSDDQTDVVVCNGKLIARAPEQIRGHMEARGVGIIPTATVAASRLRLAVQPVHGAVDRMPDFGAWALPGLSEPSIALVEIAPFEASAVEKLRVALRVVLSA